MRKPELLLASVAFSPGPGLRADADRFQIAGKPLLVVSDGTGSVAQRFFLWRQKWAEPAFVDRFHESFVRGDNAFFKQRPDRVVHELHPLRSA